MTPSDDDRLRARLAALADAVPVEQRRLAAASGTARPVRSTIRTMALPGALGTAVLLVALVAGVSWFAGQPPAATPGSSVVGVSTDGDFELTVRADQSTYGVDEPITVSASLVYRGALASIQVYGSASPILFGVEQLDGAHHVVEPVSDASCRQQTLERDQPFEAAFSKTGAFSGTDPDASFKASYLADPVLRLLAGTWRINAEASFAEGSCGGQSHRFRASVTVTVGQSQSAVPSVIPSPTLSVEPSAASAAFPAVCADLDVTFNQCAGFAAWAVGQSGVVPGQIQRIGMTRAPCPGASPCPSGAAGYIVSVHIVTDAGASSDEVVDCTRVPGSLGGINLGGINFLCDTITDGNGRVLQYPNVTSAISGGYHDVPCAGPAPDNPCATALPTIEPSAVAAAQPLAINAHDIPIDHAGAYSINLGEASLPNGILTAASADVTSSPTNPLVSYDGYALNVTSLDGGPPFDNYYAHGWRPGVEHVSVTLNFTVLLFQPGAVVHVANVDVH